MRAALLLFAAFAQATTAAAPLLPTSPWSVEYAESACVLSRSFGGTPNAPIATLQLKPSSFAKTAFLTFVTNTSRRKPPVQRLATVGFLPSGRKERVEYWLKWASKPPRQSMDFHMEADLLKSLYSSDSMSVTLEGDMLLDVTNMKIAGALGALRSCQDDLLRKWGLDPTIIDRIATPAVPLRGGFVRWLKPSDWPADAIRARVSGRSLIAWKIKADGKPAECRIITSSGHRSLDVMACAVVIERGAYTPALDHAGQPMTTYETQNVTWSY